MINSILYRVSRELSLKVSDPAIIADQAGLAEVRERDRRDGAYRPEIRGI